MNQISNISKTINPLISLAIIAKENQKQWKLIRNKDEASKEKHKKTLADAKAAPLRTNNLNKRQKLTQNKLYQRRSVTTTRGVDISPQVKNSIKSDIQRPTSSNGIENSKRNNWFKDYPKNENLLLSSNIIDLYESKKAFSFIANTKTKKSAYYTQGKRNSSRRSNGYAKKSHSFSMTKKFKGLQKIFAKDPTAKLRHHNQTPNNQIGTVIPIPQTNSINNSNMIANKNILHHASWRRKPIKSTKLDGNQYYESEKDKFWQWDLLANTSSSRGNKNKSILDLSGIIPMSGNRTTLIKKSSINVPNFRSTSKNKFCMSNRANLREMRTSEQNSATANYIKSNPLSFHIQNDKNNSRCWISAIGMHTHYLNNSIGESEELMEMNNNKKQKGAHVTQKFNSGRFQYSSQEGNPNYSSLSNSGFPDEKYSNRQRNRASVNTYHQQRKVKSKTSKGYYKSTTEKSDMKSNSKSNKRKASKRNRGSKLHDNNQTPISMSVIAKASNHDVTDEQDSIAKRKRRKIQSIESAKYHQKNISDNSVMYTSHSCGPHIQELIDSKAGKQASVAIQPSYSPYVSNTGNKKSSQRSKSTNPHIANNPHSKMNWSEGFVNIDLSQLPHDMTQREVIETMIRKHEISNFLYTNEDEDTSRFMIQNPDDRRTWRRSQYSKKNDTVEDLCNVNDTSTPIDFYKKMTIGSKTNSISANTTPIEVDMVTSNRSKNSTKLNLISEDVISKLIKSMSENIKCLENWENTKLKPSSTSQEEKKFFLYCNMLEELSHHYPILKDLLTTIKEGFQTTIRSIVANEIKEKGIRESYKIIEEREQFSKIKQQADNRAQIIEEQVNIIESKDDIIQQMKHKVSSLKNENQNLQDILEKHRVNGIKLQDENDRLKSEMERIHKMEEEIIERWEMFESTDQDLAIALKDMREKENNQNIMKLAKHSKNVPKLDLNKVQEIIRQKCDEEDAENYEEEEEESDYSETESEKLSIDAKQYNSERHNYDDSSEELNSNAKNNIKALLQYSTKKQNQAFHDQPKVQTTNLFDYKQKQNDNHNENLSNNSQLQNWQLEQSLSKKSESSWIGSDRYMLYDDSSCSSSYRSNNTNEENKNRIWIPKLNLGMPKIQEGPAQKPWIVKPLNIKPPVQVPNLENIKKKDFQDEFMDKYNEFSDSWREQIEREKRF